MQADEDDATSCWIHAVLHKIEGDAGNSRYWYRRAGQSYEAYPDAKAELAAIKAVLTYCVRQRAAVPPSSNRRKGPPSAPAYSAGVSPRAGTRAVLGSTCRSAAALHALGRHAAIAPAAALASRSSSSPASCFRSSGLRPDISPSRSAARGRSAPPSAARWRAGCLVEAAVAAVLAQPALVLLILERVDVLHADDDAQALGETHVRVALAELRRGTAGRAWRCSRAWSATGRNRPRAASTPSAPTAPARCRSARSRRRRAPRSGTCGSHGAAAPRGRSLETSRSNSVRWPPPGSRSIERHRRRRRRPLDTNVRPARGRRLAARGDQVVDDGAPLLLDRLQPVAAHQHGADAGVGIGVDHQHLLAVVGRQRLGERQDERRLADAALGVHDRDGVAHASPIALDTRTTQRGNQENLWRSQLRKAHVRHPPARAMESGGLPGYPYRPRWPPAQVSTLNGLKLVSRS